jgi:hypothetical protein
LEEDPAEIDPCSYPSVQQRYTLAAFYFATGGDDWEESFGWLSDSQECSWVGIGCNGGDNAVTSIDLRKREVKNSLRVDPDIAFYSVAD